MSKQVTQQFRNATADEIFAAQSAATRLVCPDLSQPQSPRPVNPESRYEELKQELFQLEFRLQDSERRLEGLTSDLKELERKVKAKKSALEHLPELPGTQAARQRLAAEITPLEEVIADLKPRREAMIRLVGASKNQLRDWQEEHSDEFEAFREIVKALDAARV